MNANNGNNNQQENNVEATHEIPADSTKSDSENGDEVRDEKTTDKNHDNNLPGESANGGRDDDVNDNGGGGADGFHAEECSNAESSGGDYPLCYAGNAPQMFDGNCGMVYPHDSNGGQHHHHQQFFPPSFDPHHRHSLFDPSAAAYHPASPANHLGPPPVNCMPPSLLSPPSLPPMPVMPTPPPAMTGDPNLDATRQYYEARMREHAMQYANAAAGAAWAAARIATGGGMPEGYGQFSPAPNQSYYAPASGPSAGSNMAMIMGGGSPFNTNHKTSDGPLRQQKRTLWNPASSSERKSKGPKAGGPSSGAPKKGGSRPEGRGVPPRSPAPSGIPNEKKRSEREIRGNDSVSSLGSESRGRDLGAGGNSRGVGRSTDGKREGKKGHQRRRFNEDDNGRGGDADGGNLRQNKRGLHHGHSSRGSFGSFGSGNGNGARGRNKKKNRSQKEPSGDATVPEDNGGGGKSSPSEVPASIHLGGLIGKNGARALHELCSKYRWEMPKYNSIVPQNLENSRDNDGSSNNDISFVLTVHINGVELGRGRGGTKVSAKQDASRKAMAALVPGVVFDPNGILLDVGSSELLLRGGPAKNDDGVPAGGGCDANNVGSKPLSLDELGPHLASQLAIGGNGNANLGVRSRPTSPDHSESSSISTAISEEVMISGGPLILGGPLSQKHQLASPSASASGGAGRFFSSNIYPCASTTSGVSSASDVDEIEDENAYYSSRGASVCSTLLHAMWQIDERIKEPPSYAFDLCPSPVNVNVKGPAVPLGAACSKRKKVESSREVAVRMFQCAASLNLYFPRHLGGEKDVMDYWESPLDHLQSKGMFPSAYGKCGSSQSRKRKDSFASQSTPSPLRPQHNDGVEEHQEEPSPKSKQEMEEEELIIQHKIESIGTGSTKRESKHKASAKLLAALFPGCKSMLEVKAEAEAARELYAANKAAESQTKRAKLTTGSSPEGRAGTSKRSSALSKASSAEKSDASFHAAFSRPINQQTNDFSLHALSLSEKEGTKRIKWSESMNANASELDLEIHHLRKSIENEVDAALQSFQELDEGGRSWATSHLSSNDVGKIILRRANPDDTDSIHSLLNKNESSSATMTKKKLFSNTHHESEDTDEIDVPSSEPGNVEDDSVDEENNAVTEDAKREQEQLPAFRRNSILLVLSRAVALHDPPLGCAILALSSPSNNEGEQRNLTLCRLVHEGHLPRERFLECLESFAKNIQCNLDSSACSAGLCNSRGGMGVAVTSEEIRSFLSSTSASPQPYHHPDDVGPPIQHLQSVKEEDSEEVDDGSEVGGDVVDGGDNKKPHTGSDEGCSNLVKGRPCKPSKRSRVA